VNLIALRAFGSIGLYSFVAIRRRQRGQITTGCFGRGPMPEKLNTIKRTCQSGPVIEGHADPIDDLLNDRVSLDTP
jgi:hypothetical protein